MIDLAAHAQVQAPDAKSQAQSSSLRSEGVHAKRREEMVPSSLLGVGQSLSRVSDAVLLQIWTLSDDPGALSRTNKRFRAVSKDTFARARWFLTRFRRHEVLFEAIARPGVFDAKLLMQLLKGRAVLSRSLVQLLHGTRNPPSRQHCRWGIGLTAFSYETLLRTAQLLHGNISFNALNMDDYVFTELIEKAKREKGKSRKVAPQMVEMISRFGYMPLPLHFAFDYSAPAPADGVRSLAVFPASDFRSAHRTEHALLQLPGLAPVMIANGYEMALSASDWMCRQLLNNQAKLTSASLRAKLEMLQDARVLQISRTVASNVIFDLRPKSLKKLQLPSSALTAYDILLALHRSEKLAFDLEDVVQEMAVLLSSGSVDATVINLVERLAPDFPSVNFSPLWVQYEFRNAEDARMTDLDAIAARMAPHKVTPHDVLQACLRNGCRSTMPIMYAAKYLKEEFDVPSFIEELVEGILNQPYRGIMLQRLDKLPATILRGSLPAVKINFREILAKAVERKAFNHTQLPAQFWCRKDVKSPVTCNESPPTRSLLSFCFEAGQRDSPHLSNAEPVDNNRVLERQWSRLDKYTGPADVGGFTRFGAQGDAKLQQWSDGLGCVELERLSNFVDLIIPEYDYDCHVARCQNIMAKNDKAVAEKIVEILGPDSRAADVVLQHSILNGNGCLTSTLLSSGVKLNLEHLRIASTVSWRFGSEVEDYIKRGGPFLASHGAIPNEADPTLGQRAMDCSSEEEEKEWRAIAASGVWPRALLLHDEAGTIRFEVLRGSRSDVVARIPTEPAIQAQSAVGQRSLSMPRESSGTNIKLKRAPPAEHYVIMEHSWRPVMITRQDYEERLNSPSTSLWLQYLEELHRRGTLQEKALEIALDAQELPGHWAGGCSTSAHYSIGQVAEMIKKMHKTLEEAIPVSQPELVRAELAAHNALRYPQCEKQLPACLQRIAQLYEPSA